MAETWRATEKADRRAQYLTAAGRLFAERGYRAVSIEDLGAAVGVSGPALYKHFASKEQMLIELLTGASRRLLDGFDTTVSENTSDLQTLRSLIDFHLDFALSERDVIRMQDRELANLPPDANHDVRELQRRYLDGWQQIVSRIRPALAPADLEVRMHALFGVLNSTPYSDRIQHADVRAVLSDAAFAVLLGQAAGAAADIREVRSEPSIALG